MEGVEDGLKYRGLRRCTPEGTRESHPSVHDLQSTTSFACNPRRVLPSWMSQILDTGMGFPSPSPNVVFDYFSHSCLKMCKMCIKRTPDATFLDCLALTFCDVIGELLPEWACLTLQGGTTFLLASKLADIPVSRVRKNNCTLRYKISLFEFSLLQLYQSACGNKKFCEQISYEQICRYNEIIMLLLRHNISF